jgi:mannosyltransferase OCH1-like enzyme
MYLLMGFLPGLRTSNPVPPPATTSAPAGPLTNTTFPKDEAINASKISKDDKPPSQTASHFPRTLIPFKLHQQGSSKSSFSWFNSFVVGTFDRVQPHGKRIKHEKWVDEEILKFINKSYPQYLSFYKGLPHHIYRADLSRYMIVNTFGGLYSDTVSVLCYTLDRYVERRLI